MLRLPREASFHADTSHGSGDVQVDFHDVGLAAEGGAVLLPPRDRRRGDSGEDDERESDDRAEIGAVACHSEERSDE